MSLPQNQKVVCGFHNNCSDGLSSAWAVWRKYPDATFVPLDYGDPPNFHLDQDTLLIIVDFSYNTPVMKWLWSQCGRMIFLDHHTKSEGIANALRLDCVREQRSRLGEDSFLYNANRSGATMAWHYFHPAKPCPELLSHVEDHDLWKFELKDTRAVLAGLSMYPRTTDYIFEAFGEDPDRLIPELKEKGQPIVKREDADVENIIKMTLRYVDIFGHTHVPLVNCLPWMANWTLAKLTKDHPFAVSYYDTKQHRCFSLRSQSPEKADVEAIASAFGGGGHRCASGHRVSRDHKWAQL